MVLSAPLTRRTLNRALLASALDVLTGGRALATVARVVWTPLFDFAIAGGAYHGLGAALPSLAAGQSLDLRREPGNPFDANAIAVHGADGARLGYVPRRANPRVARLMDEGRLVRAEIIRQTTASDADDRPQNLVSTGFAVGDPVIRLTVDGPIDGKTGDGPSA